MELTTAKLRFFRNDPAALSAAASADALSEKTPKQVEPAPERPEKAAPYSRNWDSMFR
jgi:hypothetical protein